VKLHHLHVLKNTSLEEDFNQGLFTPLTLEEYTRRVILFLEHVRPNIAIHRLVAMSSNWDHLVAPNWTKYKMANYQFILDQMKSQNTHQGARYQA
jgi:radical SAM superfamily enzyme